MTNKKPIWFREIPGHWTQWVLWGCLAVLIVVGLLFKYYEPSSPIQAQEPDLPSNVDYPPSLQTTESIEIRVRPLSVIGIRTRESFWELRKSLVQEHQNLGIFPTSYEIDGPDQRPIYEGIDWNVEWLEPTRAFILNPYLLAAAARTSSVTTVASRVQPRLRYANGTIVEEYFGDKGRQWLRYFRRKESPEGSRVQIWFVNATDAGYRYAGLDTRACRNVSSVDPIKQRQANHLLNNVMRLNHQYYHHGRLGYNNLSPDDFDARLALVDIRQETKIAIKLWRKQPHSLADDPDLWYVIHVKPY